jgi:hypothetical protein
MGLLRTLVLKVAAFQPLAAAVGTPDNRLAITIVPPEVDVAVVVVATAMSCVLVRKVLLMAYLGTVAGKVGTQTTVLVVAVVEQAVLVVRQLRLRLLVLVAQDLTLLLGEVKAQEQLVMAAAAVAQQQTEQTTVLVVLVAVVLAVAIMVLQTLAAVAVAQLLQTTIWVETAVLALFSSGSRYNRKQVSTWHISHE